MFAMKLLSVSGYECSFELYQRVLLSDGNKYTHFLMKGLVICITTDTLSSKLITECKNHFIN